MLSLEPPSLRRSCTPPTWRRSNPFATRFIRPGALVFVRPDADGFGRPDADGSGHPDADGFGRTDADVDAETNTEAGGPLAERFGQLRQAAITGPHGNGKSTLLRTLLPYLRPQFPHIHMWRLNRGQRPPAALLAHVARCGPERLLIIDGFEQLPRMLRFIIPRWMRFRGGSLLVTSHAPVSGLETLWQAALTHALARRLTLGLLADYEDCRPALMACFERHWQSGQRNLRDLWFAMYDDFERQRPA